MTADRKAALGQDTVARLRRWADARDRHNPWGHGKTGTALLREAADVIAEQDREIARLQRDNEHAYHAWRELTEGTGARV